MVARNYPEVTISIGSHGARLTWDDRLLDHNQEPLFFTLWPPVGSRAFSQDLTWKDLSPRYRRAVSRALSEGDVDLNPRKAQA